MTKTFPLIFLLIVPLFAVYINAGELSEKDYLQLKNRLKAEFMEKLKEEIKEELLTELRKDYTIVPKQKQEGAIPPTVESGAENQFEGESNFLSAPKSGNEKEVTLPYERSSAVTEQTRVNNQNEKLTNFVKKINGEPTFETAGQYYDNNKDMDWNTSGFTLGKGITFGEELLTIRGFGNINASYQDDNIGDNVDESNTFFALGEFDLFMTSRLSNRIEFLGEMVFEFEEDEEVKTDMERLIIHYDINTLLKIEAGKFHLPIGYWLPTFHHGVWLHTTRERPDIFRFEDMGGPLPSHGTGIKLTGSALFESFDLNYSLVMSNGRGVDTTQQLWSKDLNDEKAWTVQIELQPHILHGLRLGPSFYYDVIPEDKNNPNRESEIMELIYGGHIVYDMGNVELLFEAFKIHHDEFSGGVFNTFGGYGQFAYRINNFKPYYRFDYIDYDNNDPFYLESDFDYPDTKKHTIGLRYDLSYFNALKLDYSYGKFDDEHVNIIGAQTAFSF